MELFENSCDHLTGIHFARCLLIRLIHVVSRRCPYNPIWQVWANYLYRDLLKVILPTLNALPQPTSLLWFVTAARPILEGTNPFPLESILGQTGNMLRRFSPYRAVGSEVPVWPIFSLTTPQGTLPADFFKAYCVPLAKAVVGKEAAKVEVELVAVLVNRKKRVEARKQEDRGPQISPASAVPDLPSSGLEFGLFGHLLPGV